MNDISQICDIHIESSTEATAFDRRQDPDVSAVDGPFFSQGMVGTVTTTITSNANSHREASAAKVATKASRHRAPVLSRLYKAKDPHPETKTDNSKGNRTQSNQLLETESRIGRWSYTLTNGRIRDESPARSAPAIPKMTKDEFDALPPIIQRKYFSTSERLRFAQEADTTSVASTEESFDTTSEEVEPPLITLVSAPSSSQNRLAENTTLDKKQFRPVIKRRPVPAPTYNYIEARASQVYAHPEDKRKSLSQGHLPIYIRRQSASLNVAAEGATESSSAKPPSHSKHSLSTSSELTIRRKSLNRSASVDHLGIRMIPQSSEYAWMDGRIKATEDSIYNSFRWLEEEDGLDLSLNVQDYHDDVERESAVKSPVPSFRRHLSISSKLNLRQSISLSRPGTMDTGSPMLFGSGSAMSVPGSPNHGHARRRSRALSLMSLSPTKQFAQETPQSPSLNEPVNHYQDPETRLKLRAYLSSAHKFDEAVEFGFPSADKAPDTDEPPKLLPIRIDSLPQPSFEYGGLSIMKTLPEDRRCSLYSDGATNSEPDSPRTPTDMSRPALGRININTQEQVRDTTPKASEAVATPVSAREMTLRMTLTRPDLRANEEQIYGWLKPKSAAGSTSTDDAVSSVTQKRDDTSKESIEREFAAYDLENLLSGDHGPMRRFWNRVRRN